MANTVFSAIPGLTSEHLALLRPQRRPLFLLLFKEHKLRPPVLEEMMPDLQRVIACCARRFSDMSSSQLNYDEMVGEGNLKLAELITKGEIERQTSRLNFFKLFATSVNNNARSRVVKYVYTEKRSGQKPPPREERFTPAPKVNEGDEPLPVEYHKRIDLSLDDPDLGLQVPDGHHHGEDEDRAINWGFNPTSAEHAYHLTPVEKLVFHEMIAPSPHAMCHAEEAAMRRTSKGAIHVKIKRAHMAEAVGMSPELFEEAVLSIQTKITFYRMANNEQLDLEARRSATIAQLKEVFCLQIPPDMDDKVVRRMLTMAARDQFDKVTPQLSEMLAEVGAKVPRSIGNNKLACYGVLHQRNCRMCNTCDLRHSCAVEAANIGLTNMAISPALLGSKQTRTPVLLPRMANEVAHQITSADEAEVISHLDETFQQAVREGLTYYYHHIGPNKRRRYLFCVESAFPLLLRFCNPSDDLKKKLEGKQKTWVASAATALPALIALIEQHGKETFEAE